MLATLSRWRNISAAHDDDSFVVIPKVQSSSQDDIPEVFRLPKLNDVDLYEIDVAAIQQHYADGTFTAEEYTKYCLEQIRKTNHYLEAVIETNPDAVAIAQKLDKERKDGKNRGPLHGIPVLVKDNMATADKQQTTAGSWALLGCTVPKDAHIVSLLRTAGAIILGKANLDEWAGMRCHDYSCGFSGRGGQCRNAFILSRSPNGSSSGSAVAVSANLVPLAFGTETDCSVISPGMVNGVVAIKPTVGLTSRGGVIPISETQDSVGTYGRIVADAALALDAIAGPDVDDTFSTAPDRWQPKRGYYGSLSDKSALKGARFGLPMTRFWDAAPEPQRKVVEKVLAMIKEAGAEIVPVEMPCAEERLPEDGEWNWERYGTTNPSISEITVSKIQTYYLMTRYLSSLRNTTMRTLDDIVAYNIANSGSEGGLPGTHPAFPDGQDLFVQCCETKGIKTPEYHAALKHITKQCRENGIDAALIDHERTAKEGRDVRLDALLFCDVKRGGIQIAAQAGYPIVNLPVGLDPDGMPVGLTVQHTRWRDDLCVRWASAVEDLLVSVERKGGRGEWVGRVPPLFEDRFAKNVPVDECYRYERVVGKSGGKDKEMREHQAVGWAKCRYWL